MLTRAQQLRFSFLLRCGALGCFTRDRLAEQFAPRSEYARSRREAKAMRSPLVQSLMVPHGERSLEAQLVMPEQPQALVLICHGIGERLYFWTETQLLLEAHNIGSLVFHYASYGKSQGNFTPAEVSADTSAAWSYLSKISGPAKISGAASGLPAFILGTSLGTAVAIHAVPALQPQPAGLILSQGFSSIREAAQAVLAKLHLPLGFIANLLPDTWRNTEELASLDCPVLVIHSPADELFAFSMGQELYAAAASRENTRQSFVAPDGFPHNVSLRPHRDYWQPILTFIAEEAAQCARNAEAATKSPPSPSSTAVVT